MSEKNQIAELLRRIEALEKGLTPIVSDEAPDEAPEEPPVPFTLEDGNTVTAATVDEALLQANPHTVFSAIRQPVHIQGHGVFSITQEADSKAGTRVTIAVSSGAEFMFRLACTKCEAELVIGPDSEEVKLCEHVTVALTGGHSSERDQP